MSLLSGEHSVEFESALTDGLRVLGESTPTTATLYLRGFVDISTCGHLYESANAYLEQGVKHLVLDAADLSFMDSSGVEVLLRLQKQAAADGGWLSIVNPTQVLCRLLFLLGLDEIVEIDLTSL
jgi:anti-sigma B factor antagonist